MELTHGSLFSGIGGFDLGFERAGFKTLWQVEIDPYCQAVLQRHWPDVPRIADIKTFMPTNWPRPAILTGGFPCQPVSLAGQRRAQADARWLWPEMCRVINEIKPTWVVAENVPGLLSMGYEQVCADLESEGYEVGTVEIPACAVGHPHRRNRLWILAHTTCLRMVEGRAEECRTETRQPVPSSLVPHESWPTIAHQLCRVDNGVSHRVHRGTALGNAIVPQIAEEIAWMIRAAMEQP